MSLSTNMHNSGLLIAIEGIDGSGKSTLAAAINTHLAAHNIEALLTKEPGASKLGQKLRTILNHEKALVGDRAEYLLFAADRAQHFEEIVLPALRAKKIVISDRMADSSLAYQGYGRNLDKTIIQLVNRWAMQDRVPDLVFYIDIPVDVAFKRIKNRQDIVTSFEQEAKEFWLRVQQGFETLFKDRNNVIRLDGTQPSDELALHAATMIMEHWHSR